MSAESRWLTLVWPGLAALASLLVYWPIGGGLLQGALGVDGAAVESWFFSPASAPTGGTLLIAAWMAWRRLGRLAPAARLATSEWLVAAGLLSAAGLLVGWARLTGAPHLLCLSLVALLPATGMLLAARAGLRATLAPTVVVLLALPIPDPLLNEIVWALQRWTAAGALWLMQLAGLEATGTGVKLYYAGNSFLVIEECSGLRAIRTLWIASFVIGDLCAVTPRRRLALLAFAPVLSLGLNVVRVAWIAADPPEQGLGGAGDHIGQGVGTLIAGCAILYRLVLPLPRWASR